MQEKNMAQLGLIDTFLENTSVLFYNDFFKIPQNLNTNIYWKLNGTKGNNSYIAIM